MTKSRVVTFKEIWLFFLLSQISPHPAHTIKFHHLWIDGSLSMKLLESKQRLWKSPQPLSYNQWFLLSWSLAFLGDFCLVTNLSLAVYTKIGLILFYACKVDVNHTSAVVCQIDLFGVHLAWVGLRNFGKLSWRNSLIFHKEGSKLSRSRNIVLKQHFTLSCIYYSVIPTRTLSSLLGLKILISFHHFLSK